MLRSTWQNNFMFGIIILAILFILAVGWVIVMHHDDQATLDPTTFNQPKHPTHPSKILADKPSSNAVPNNFSAGFVQQMSNQLKSNNSGTSSNMASSSQVSQKNFSPEFEKGFQWASTNRIKNTSQCSNNSKDYLQGCQTFIEIDNYIDQIQVSPNFKASD